MKMLMSGVFCVVLMLLTGCMHKTITPTDTGVRNSLSPAQIDELFRLDTDNKRWAQVYIDEMDAAIEHDDSVSFIFFMNEFNKIDQQIVPLYLRGDVRYTQPVYRLMHHVTIRLFLPAD